MPIESLSHRTPHPRYGLVDYSELPPSTGNLDNVPQLSGHQPDANFSAAYNGQNYAEDGQYRDDLDRGNLWYQRQPPLAASLENQYTHELNPRVGYPPPGNAQHMSATSDTSHGERYMPPARAPHLPNNGVRERPPPPEGTDPFSQNVPNLDPSRMSATEDLKRLMSRYLDNPDSRVNTFRVGLNPSGSRLRVMIMLDIDL